jgi:ParB family chromosome partitioning protein
MTEALNESDMDSQLPIDDIRIERRYRKDIGSLDDLKLSIETHGLLQPICITPEKVLVFGERRLRACRELGMRLIPVRVVDLENPLQAEYDENECRKPFTTSEKVAIAKAIEEMEAAKAKERQREAGGDRKSNKGKIACENFSQAIDHDSNKSKAKAADAVGMSRPTLAKAQAVVEAAEADPELRPVVEEMDRTGKVSPAFQKIQEAKGEAKAPEPIKGVGIRVANEAINLLSRIPKNDCFRERGFQIVSDWLKQARSK